MYLQLKIRQQETSRACMIHPLAPSHNLSPMNSLNHLRHLWTFTLPWQQTMFVGCKAKSDHCDHLSCSVKNKAKNFVSHCCLWGAMCEVLWEHGNIWIWEPKYVALLLQNKDRLRISVFYSSQLWVCRQPLADLRLLKCSSIDTSLRQWATTIQLPG